MTDERMDIALAIESELEMHWLDLWERWSTQDERYYDQHKD